MASSEEELFDPVFLILECLWACRLWHRLSWFGVCRGFLVSMFCNFYVVKLHVLYGLKAGWVFHKFFCKRVVRVGYLGAFTLFFQKSLIVIFLQFFMTSHFDSFFLLCFSTAFISALPSVTLDGPMGCPSNVWGSASHAITIFLPYDPVTMRSSSVRQKRVRTEEIFNVFCDIELLPLQRADVFR